MSVQDFLQEKRLSGDLDSEGCFKIDLHKALAAQTDFALPSPLHYALKVIQVANQLQAKSIVVGTRANQTTFTFQAELTEACLDFDQILQSLTQTVSIEDPLMRNLSTAIRGTIRSENSSCTWVVECGGHRSSIEIGGKFRIKIDHVSVDSHSDKATFTFSLGHRKTWQFWTASVRRKELTALLEQHCRYSPAPISIDGKCLEAPEASGLNEHLREIRGGRFNAATGTTPTAKSRVAATNIQFNLSSTPGCSFSVQKPDQDSYALASEGVNIWSQGLHKGNQAMPDGETEPAWMLQFVNPDGRNVSSEEAQRFEFCQSVITFNIHGPGNSEKLRLKIVQFGVLVLDAQISENFDELDEFRGCIFLFADDELETDLTGLQIVQNDKFVNRLLAFRELVQQGYTYFDECTDLVNIV